MTVKREDWLDDIEDVIRSRHYTWIPEGLGGEPVDEAMSWLVTDIMHICRRAGVDSEDVLKQGRVRFQQEEIELIAAAAAVEPDSVSFAPCALSRFTQRWLQDFTGRLRMLLTHRAAWSSFRVSGCRSASVCYSLRCAIRNVVCLEFSLTARNCAVVRISP
ncbi:MAG: hypothetical protein ACI8P0_004600 [Planctomycetaceae bacterium]|jgi:hypothetical protein